MAIKFLQDIDVDGEVQGTSLDINGNADISGTLDLHDEITSYASGAMFRKKNDSWSNATNHDVIYQGWYANTGDYVYLKAPGNSTTDHGIAFIGDDVIALGRSDVENGSIDSNSATAPLSENWFVLNSSNATFAGDITVSGGDATINNSSAESELFINGTGNGYVNAAVILECQDDNGHSRGAGIYMNNVVGETEWFAGRPYSVGDSYQILRRHTTSGNHDNSTASSGTSNTSALLDVSNAGLLTIADDLVIKSSGTIGGSNDPDLLTLGNGTLTVAGNLSVTGADVTITGSIIHNSDTNTYFGFHANDSWRVVTGGSERLEVTDSGMKLGNTGATVTQILDEDNMASNSATSLATQQSIKAYVDANAGGTIDIDGQTDIGAALVDADIFLVDDGANGTNRKATMARLSAYINGKVPDASDSDKGLIKVNATDASVVPNNPSTTSGRSYPVQTDESGVASVNVPWTDTTTDSTKLPLAGGTITGTTTLNSDIALRFGSSSTFIEGATSGTKLMLNANTDIFFRINGSTVGQYDPTGAFTTGNMTVNGDTFTFESANADDPLFLIKNTTDDDQASRLQFQKLRADDGVATGQNLGEVWFTGQDSAQNTQDYAYIIGEIDVSTGGQESGQLVFGVASHDGGNNTGFKLTGGSVDNEVDVTIGNGAASVTAVQGLLTAVGTITGSADVIAYSDQKLKENVKTLDGKKVLEMRGVSFDRIDTGKASSGVIAQEIQKVAPELVHDTDGTLGVAYGNLVGYLIEAIKDQQKQIDELKELCNGCSK